MLQSNAEPGSLPSTLRAVGESLEQRGGLVEADRASSSGAEEASSSQIGLCAELERQQINPRGLNLGDAPAQIRLGAAFSCRVTPSGRGDQRFEPQRGHFRTFAVRFRRSGARASTVSLRPATARSSSSSTAEPTSWADPATRPSSTFVSRQISKG